MFVVDSTFNFLMDYKNIFILFLRLAIFLTILKLSFLLNRRFFNNYLLINNKGLKLKLVCYQLGLYLCTQLSSIKLLTICDFDQSSEFLFALLCLMQFIICCSVIFKELNIFKKIRHLTLGLVGFIIILIFLKMILIFELGNKNIFSTTIIFATYVIFIISIAKFLNHKQLILKKIIVSWMIYLINNVNHKKLFNNYLVKIFILNYLTEIMAIINTFINFDCYLNYQKLVISFEELGEQVNEEQLLINNLQLFLIVKSLVIIRKVSFKKIILKLMVDVGY
ncbi:hypothetical protein [Spiroplasma eriocheiris]|uniref:Transmembrane protein n=1 Tax=Spiroplasma eriocheiris TaxID=315358 RepID=A0A0H3XIS1_9MOLU|nr:hypothetical protein [Spiroplasma eriocheiris]AHF57171.1 hypothetical protein SPE_0033 [Spiroplasma eriocheiris CCTCC M 207170]AKM53641.1 hypothetical protein SERIO_v1c00350 [Spiroplasma eriocheiris]